MEGQLVVNQYCDFSCIFPKCNKDAYVSLFFPRPPLILSSVMLSFDSLSKLLQVLLTIFIFGLFWIRISVFFSRLSSFIVKILAFLGANEVCMDWIEIKKSGFHVNAMLSVYIFKKAKFTNEYDFLIKPNFL